MHIVTGGAGFIGSNIAAALESRGSEVAIIDVLGKDEKWRNLAKRRLADLIVPDQAMAMLQALGGRVEGIVHMGAISATTERDADLIVETNFRLSCRLWEWCSVQKVPFVYASSAATYGDGAAGFEDHDDSRHLAQLTPLNAYGWSKHLFDRWVSHRVASGGPTPLRWSGLKFFNVYGPNEYHKGSMRSVAVQLFEQISRGEPARLFASDRADYPDGGQKRDFVWVGDCVDIALWFLDGARPNGIYNVGSGRARSFVDLAKAVFSAMDRSAQIEFIPTPEALKGRYQYFTQASMQKLSAAGYSKPMTELELGVHRYVREFLATQDAYR